MIVIDKKVLEKELTNICDRGQCEYDNGVLYLDDTGVRLTFQDDSIIVDTPYTKFEFKLPIKIK